MKAARTSLLLVAAVVMSGGVRAEADPVPPAGRADQPAPELEGIRIDEKLGARLPLDLVLTDETGAPIRLGSLFGHGKPVLLTFNYSSCPMLCSLQLGGLVASLNELTWQIGKEFEIITVGLNPMEGHRRAMQSKIRYLGRYKAGDPELADAGWHFLTGSDAAIRALADAVGYRYKLHPTTGEYLHPAALMVLTPEGVVSSYVYGIEYPSASLAVTLLGARKGELKEATEKFLMACFHYVSPKGAAAVAVRIMQVGAIVFVAGIAIAFGMARVIRSRRRAHTRMPDVGSR